MRHLWQTSGTLAALAVAVAISHALGQSYYQSPQYPQYVQYPNGGPPVPGALAGQILLNDDQLDQLLAPIALYPDPLLSLIFPGSTFPEDLFAAQRWLQYTPNPTESNINAQAWDDSVKGLVHYPTVLKMMDDQRDWTYALGAAFLNQQQDAMDSVQRLRVAAQYAQNLRNSDQAQIILDADAIRIEPVNPDVIYVPVYDPVIVYSRPYPISYSIGYPLGFWCDFDFDWHHRSIIFGGGWFSGWRHPDDWDRLWRDRDRDRDPRAAVWNSPRIWERSQRRPPPRLTQTIVTRVGLDKPRVSPARTAPDSANRRNQPAQLPVGRQPSAVPLNNVFVPPSNQEAERDRQRIQQNNNRQAPAVKSAPPAPPARNNSARPTTPRPATPEPAASPASSNAPHNSSIRPLPTPAIKPASPSPPRKVIAPAPVPRQTPIAPARAITPPGRADKEPQNPQGNAFRGEANGKETRQESDRGRSSIRR